MKTNLGFINLVPSTASCLDFGVMVAVGAPPYIIAQDFHL